MKHCQVAGCNEPADYQCVQSRHYYCQRHKDALKGRRFIGNIPYRFRYVRKTRVIYP